MNLKARQKIIERNKKRAEEVDKLAASWNPLPVRGQQQVRLSSTIESNSNFINCKQKYFNKGKYKGIDVKDVPRWYLKWVVDNIQLNQSELNLIRKTIK